MAALERSRAALMMMLLCIAVTACSSANKPSPSAGRTSQAPGLDIGSVCGGSFETAAARDHQELEQLSLVDLWFEDAVPEKDRQDIKAGLAHAQSYITSHFTAPPLSVLASTFARPQKAPCAAA